MIKKLFLDTETTGVEIEESHVIEIGMIIEYGNIYKEHILNCAPSDPDYSLTEIAEEKHGYSREDIDKFPSSIETYNSLIKILGGHVNKFDRTDKFVVYGYGAEFDVQMMRKFFLCNGDNFFGSHFWHPWVDIMTLAMNYLADQRHRLENFKLGTVAEYLGIETDNKKLHGALYDAWLCKEILRKINGEEKVEHSVEDVRKSKLERAFRRHQKSE